MSEASELALDEQGRGARRRLHATMIAIEDRLRSPYPDRLDGMSPWTAFVRPMIDIVDAAIDGLIAEVARLRMENQRQADLIDEFRKRDESVGRSLKRALAERDEARARIAWITPEPNGGEQ